MCIRDSSESGADQTGAVAAGDPACRRNHGIETGGAHLAVAAQRFVALVHEPPQRRDITRLEGPDGGVGAERLGGDVATPGLSLIHI